MGKRRYTEENGCECLPGKLNSVLTEGGQELSLGLMTLGTGALTVTTELFMTTEMFCICVVQFGSL